MRFILPLSMLFTILCHTASADGVLISWAPTQLDGMTEQRYNAARDRTVDEVVELNRSLTTWPEVYEVAIGTQARSDEPAMFQRLAEEVADLKETELKLTSRLIIWDRIVSGDIFFDGRGLQIDDDLFTTAGRANWCLRTLTKRNFGVITQETSKQEAEQIRAKWLKHLAGEKVADVTSRYQSDVKGMSELRSPSAVRALISSLKPSKEKTDYIQERLQTLYGLKAMPDKPGHPARMCNPDEYTHVFLAAVTDVAERHDHQWWAEWWKKNSNALRWNSQTAKFEVSPDGAKND